MSELLRPDDWDDPVRLPEITPPERLLVAFDGSHTAERALAWAALVAGEAEVVVLVAYLPPVTKRRRGTVDADQVQTEMADEAEVLANEAVTLLIERGARARSLVVRGDPAAAVATAIEQEDIGLVVVGRRGLTSELQGLDAALEKVRSALHGPVADRILRQASVPVLVVD
jgi:nucleotide-binding universal stress UspA family protein